MSVDHYENFPVASLLLPARLRRAVAAIYWFARGADDIADEGDADDAERLRGLAAYRTQLDRIGAGQVPAAAPAGRAFAELAEMIGQHRLPLGPMYDLLDAFTQDVRQKAYPDFEALSAYCRRSANPIGRLLLHLYGVDDPRSLSESDAICTALQLINFWQDVEIDRRKGRVYLPQDTLARAGFADGEPGPSICDGRFRAALGHEVARARALMLAGAPLAQRLPGRAGWELALVVQGGLRILEKIEAVHFDVFNHRPVLVRADWPRLAWRALRHRTGGPLQSRALPAGQP
ncbi:MAG: squalene synthase HpnC [Burkholderiales bacterium]|nr:squalene synthase HpnC [Burkholderiales bacterium]